MPLYEFQCTKCGTRDEVFARSMTAEVKTPPCPKAGKVRGHAMQRVVSKFSRHLTMADQIADAESKWGKEVDASMGPEPDVGRFARRYTELSKNLPNPNDL